MRLRAVWKTNTGNPREEMFETMTWKPKKLAVFARTKLISKNSDRLGYQGAITHKAAKEPLNSEIHLYREFGQHGALSFNHVLEVTEMETPN